MTAYMDSRRRLRDAAHLALELYPGPVGEVLAAELRSWDGFGYLLGASTALITRLVEHIEEMDRLRTAPARVVEAA